MLYQMHREYIIDGEKRYRPFFVGDYQQILSWCLWLNDLAEHRGQPCRFFVTEYGA